MQHVIFNLPEQADFKWIQSYDGLVDTEIYALKVECSSAVDLLEYELLKRQGPTNIGPILDDCCWRIKANSQRINGLSLKELMLQPKSRTSYKQGYYDEFLWLISRIVGIAHALLVRCSIGKTKMRELGLGGRAKLAQYVVQNKSLLFCTVLQDKAIELGLSDHDISQPVTTLGKRKYESQASIANAKPDTGCNTKSTSGNLDNWVAGHPAAFMSSCGRHNSIDDAINVRHTYQRANLYHVMSDAFIRSAPILSSDMENLVAPMKILNRLDFFDLNQAERLSDVDYLALLFRPLGKSTIPHVLFERALCPQPRWSEDGIQHQVMASTAGLDQRLVDILSDDARLTKAVRSLDPRSKTEWSLKILKWICFVFPRDRFWEPRFLTIGKSLLPLLRQILPQVTGNIPVHVANDVIDVLLAASKLGDFPRRQSLLAMATEVRGDHSSEYLWGAVAHEQSILSRLKADFNHSEHVIEDFCRRTVNFHHSGSFMHAFYRHLKQYPVTKKLSTIYGRLQVSHLENLVQCEKYNTAIDEIDDWTVSNNPSEMETRLLSSKQVTLCKIFRAQGRFTDAQTSLEACLKHPQNFNRLQILCGLSDVYCDLGLLEKAYALVTPEISIQRNKVRQGKGFRRLLVSAIDAHFGQSSYTNAEAAVQEAEAMYRNLTNLDVSDQLLHMRVVIASARIAHCQSQFVEAFRRWEIALNYVQTYESFISEGFTYAVIHLSICLASLEEGNAIEGWEAFQYAERILCGEMQDFWIPTFGTKWYPDTLAKIKTLKGWTLKR